MTTSDPATRPAPQPETALRDMAQVDGACADGLALEHLIDMQRACANPHGEAR